VGEHFNPTNMHHGGQTSFVRHVGDLGNIIAQGAPGNGVAHIAKSDFLISLDPNAPNSIIGKPLVIHINPDDLGRGINRESRESGNSGTKIACGNVRFG
jgi:Cu-Zn family superoxide dismutase